MTTEIAGVMLFVGFIGFVWMIMQLNRSQGESRFRQQLHHDWKCILMEIAEAALKYRSPADMIQRQRDARKLDSLLAKYKLLKAELNGH